MKRTFKSGSFLTNPIVLHDWGQNLDRWHLRILANLLDRISRIWFSCWIPHTVQIGRNCSFGYGGLGCIIHSRAVIGNDVECGAHVLIGGNARSFGVPRIEDNVYIGFGAVIIGPITIGKGAVIGANSVVNRSVPPRCVAAGNPAQIVSTDIEIDEYLYHKQTNRSEDPGPTVAITERTR